MGIDETIQALQFHVSQDIKMGKKSPNKSWPKYLADFYNNLTENERKQIMENVETKKEATKKVVVKKAVKKVVKKVAKKVSTSGKYKNMRHLLETLFHKDAEITKEAVLVVVKKEFPNSAFIQNPSSHYGWYRTHILHRNEWRYFEKPLTKMAKIK